MLINNELVLFHGTNTVFDKIDLKRSKDKRDFGKGFYITTLEAQSKSWAQNMFIRYGGSGIYVMKFKLKDISDLKVKEFKGLDEEWLNMIKNNRLNGGIQHDYDVVIGPVADDNTMRTVALYVDGIYNESMAIEQLKFSKSNNQVSLHTIRALSKLEFWGRDEYDGQIFI
ncbi:DUF3990 domain-containing protein [Clostridium botulinum]|uniref:DUF3990 domain-containing protein n=1 Tax=Clostridium botulinum TaxID=1491 RepID=UPI000773C2B0|nr:DUF3990 domain-containing protein [Clostridium botulinum]NFH80195.1 DUF3990 domain-containing protein [Clostridium botulinum]NFH81912.1 DUF3990 domain-containing protein [Clostridium botulinum]NFI09886.1 DUF3990 domain-containing protein [Clostridium botulinum]NFI14945.1 DUF3990 domain-containing protein [Clostridium botulinum]NFO85028.1 DUF3990 domain-containing protein [Clostridium botulinum]